MVKSTNTNQSTGRNTFYGIESQVLSHLISVNLPSEQNFKNVELEATDSWQLLLKQI
jgi:hypothetical protein